MGTWARFLISFIRNKFWFFLRVIKLLLNLQTIEFIIFRWWTFETTCPSHVCFCIVLPAYARKVVKSVEKPRQCVFVVVFSVGNFWRYRTGSTSRAVFMRVVTREHQHRATLGQGQGSGGMPGEQEQPECARKTEWCVQLCFDRRSVGITLWRLLEV